jgi:hypothetical protein
MAGAIAACMYPIPEEIAERCNDILTDDLRGIKDNFIQMIETKWVSRDRVTSKKCFSIRKATLY